MSILHDNESSTPAGQPGQAESTQQPGALPEPYPQDPGAAPAAATEQPDQASAVPQAPPVISETTMPKPAADVEKPESPRKPGVFGTRGRKIGGAVGGVLVAAGATFGIVDALSGPSDHKTVAEQSTDPSNTQSPSPTAASTSSQKPSNSPSPTSIPTTTETTPPSNTTGGEQLKDPSELGPTTPEAVPYVEGQAPTPEDVQILMHNIEVAANTGDLNNLLYSGIYPDSELASNTDTAFIQYYQNEKQQIGTMAGPFNIKVNDNDVTIDPSGVAHVRTAIGTDFDFTYTSAAKPRVNYTEYSFTVGNKTVTLPDGTSKNILALIGSMSATPSTYQDWNSGF